MIKTKTRYYIYERSYDPGSEFRFSLTEPESYGSSEFSSYDSLEDAQYALVRYMERNISKYSDPSYVSFDFIILPETTVYWE